MADSGRKDGDSSQEENTSDGGEKDEKQEDSSVSVRRKLKTLTFGRKKKTLTTKEKKKRLNPVWGFRLCTKNAESSLDLRDTSEYRQKESGESKPSNETVQNKVCDQSQQQLPSSSRCKPDGEPSPASIKKSCMSAYKSDLSSQRVHTQIDYIHCLVPDLLAITNCSFYWGKMDRYEAEKLLDKKSEGTFLLRDSAQEDHLFSVSFRRFDRSLHARIEQWNHRFSFDSHDPGVFSSPTVCGLIEHYKDAGHCMFFEPMLTIPLHRNFPFTLQHLCRSVICSKLTYDAIDQIELPKTLKNFLKEYHYKQQVRVRRLDVDQS